MANSPQLIGMIFPIGDDQVKGGYFPVFSYGFILLNVAIFIFENQMPQAQLAAFVNEYGSIPHEITQGNSWFTLLTSMFLHGGWMHLIGNMLFLWVFADNIEAAVGNIWFLLFYLAGGLAAVGGHIYFNWDSPVPMVGASGAISAVLGAYLVMYPASRIKLLFFIFPFRVSAWLFLGIWIIQQMLYGAESINDSEGGGVAWWAHICGFAFGILGGLVFRSAGHLGNVELEGQES